MEMGTCKQRNCSNQTIGDPKISSRPKEGFKKL